jgi:arylformamidase
MGQYESIARPRGSATRPRILEAMARKTLLDLSHPLIHGQPSFPNDPELSITPHFTVAANKVNVSRISMGSHQGTHLDAPFHFYVDGKTIERMPLERFIGPATLVDLAPRSRLKPKTPITLEMLRPHAKAFKPGARIVYRTGWERNFGKAEFFTDFPTLNIDAAEWIASRRISLLGMDTPTPSTSWLEVHLALLKRGTEIVIVESLTNLSKLPKRFTLMAFPLKFAGRDGSPVRAVAMF